MSEGETQAQDNELVDDHMGGFLKTLWLRKMQNGGLGSHGEVSI